MRLFLLWCGVAVAVFSAAIITFITIVTFIAAFIAAFISITVAVAVIVLLSAPILWPSISALTLFGLFLFIFFLVIFITASEEADYF